MLLFWSGGSTGTVSYTLADTINLSATEGSFDTIDLDCEDLASITQDDSVVEDPLLAQGDSCSLHVAEAISATVSTGSVAQSLADTISITTNDTDSLVEFDSYAFTETASITVTDAVTANQISPQALADTISISTSDLLSADIGVPITIAVEYDDTISLATVEVMGATITSEVRIVHITFSAQPDHITFST